MADIWDEQQDPALRRMREGLALPKITEPEPPEVDVAAEVRHLRDRLERGDVSVADRLRALLARIRHEG